MNNNNNFKVDFEDYVYFLNSLNFNGEYNDLKFLLSFREDKSKIRLVIKIFNKNETYETLLLSLNNCPEKIEEKELVKYIYERLILDYDNIINKVIYTCQYIEKLIQFQKLYLSDFNKKKMEDYNEYQ